MPDKTADEANMWLYGGIGGAAFATILCVGLFGIFLEDRIIPGVVLTVIGVGGLIAMALLLKGHSFGILHAAIASLIITWVFFGYTIWISYTHPIITPYTELPLPHGSSRIEVFNLKIRPLTAGQTYRSDIFVINKGKETALKMQEAGAVSLGDGPMEMSGEMISAYYAMYHARLNLSPPSELQIYPDQNNITITEEGVKLDDSRISALTALGARAYTMAMIRYTDATVPPGKWIYTEYCVFTLNGEVKPCPNHNRIYMAD
jgi:hypothetical protein